MDVVPRADERNDHEPRSHRHSELRQRDRIRGNLRLHADEHYAQTIRVCLTPLFLPDFKCMPFRASLKGKLIVTFIDDRLNNLL